MLKEKFRNKNIILASGSPRRQHFLRELNVDFEIRLKDIEEIYPDHLKAEEITNYLAELKANAFQDELIDNDVLITSDTVVWLNGKALGKPKDAVDAFNMIKEMSGKTHEVITSVCIKTVNLTTTFFEKTLVAFKELNDSEITYYIDLYKPFDKAGSYGIQEWIGLVAIEKIEGSYTNVVGLPTHRLYDELMKL
ncbi:Septum formation protein Maf [Flavobacterium indicum GPTSA100-9 = DSM 17447]|uniref:dTTP/UTP pyrophosphatase n=1 Tax=Flavobacterium indicum (strain DSM 17447 / CIP 109464 / GPTSA100-9) TaxID=1094466 RepID=H8XQV2_FLAIG|nr:Maf-like protein [Flavobacterium indicum]CCG53400.1 Septum formation protein Maf [Flavobacterium indicum GPTSA100-9 = DSM 17447]